MIAPISNCYSLEHLYAPELEELANGAFANCIKLTEFVKDGEYDLTKLKVVEAQAFAHSCFKGIYLPEITQINGSGTFQYCQAEFIDIPNVTYISTLTFNGCKNLKHINMPNFVDASRTDYENIFVDCFALEELYIPNAIYLPDILTSTAVTADDDNELSLRYIYAPKAIYTNYQYSNGFGLCHKLEWAYLPNIKYIPTMTSKWNATLYLSEKTEYIDDFPRDYSSTKIVAPEGSYAAKWANKYGLTFIPSEDLSFSAFDENSFIYSTSDGKQCSMPVDIIEQMWYDYLPINEKPDFMTHGYIFDVVNDDFINAKDFAKIHHISKYGW